MDFKGPMRTRESNHKQKIWKAGCGGNQGAESGTWSRNKSHPKRFKKHQEL